MVKRKLIKLTDLLVNTENYRFESVTSQKEAIDKMVQNQGEKLFNLANHIISYGLNPNDRIQVVQSRHNPKHFNILEGNRRIVALKLLSNPDLIDSSTFSSLKRKFKILRDNNRNKIINEVDCTHYDNPSEADIWIKLKHAGQVEGIGTVAWSANQVQRFEEKVEGKSSIPLQIINFLKKSTAVPDNIKGQLNNLTITNLSRLISDPDIRDFLGIDITNGTVISEIDSNEVAKGLVQVIRDLLRSNFKVRDIYAKVDRKDYLKKFPRDKKPNQSNLTTKPWALQDASQEGIPASKKPTKKTKVKERKTLIPKSCILRINNTKVNDIYNELQKIDVGRFTNAVAVLFRVFIELSIDCYLETNKLTKALTSSRDKTSLQQKVAIVTNHLENVKNADKNICKGIRNSTKDKNDLLGIETWHAYVHNNLYSPIDKNLKITWNNIQKFSEILWDNVN